MHERVVLLLVALAASSFVFTQRVNTTVVVDSTRSSVGVTSLHLISWEEYIQTEPLKNRSFLCVTSKFGSISSCEFRVWYLDEQEEDFLVRGTDDKASVAIASSGRRKNTVTVVRPQFSNKGCGVDLTSTTSSRLLVGCRLTDSAGVSGMNTMPLFVTDKPSLKLVDNNQQVIVRPGKSIDIMLRSSDGSALSKCSSRLANGDEVQVLPGKNNGTNQIKPANSRYKPYGGLMSDGECGFTISNVQEEDNGVFYVLAESQKAAAVKVIAVVVSEKTRYEPELVLDKTEYGVGDSLTATCSVRGVRQPEHVTWTWTLGGVPLNNKTSEEASDSGWRWPWQEVDVSQSVTRRLSEEDGDKVIGCRISGMDDSFAFKKTAVIRIKAPSSTTGFTNISTTWTPETTETTTTAQGDSTPYYDETTINSEDTTATEGTTAEIVAETRIPTPATSTKTTTTAPPTLTTTTLTSNTTTTTEASTTAFAETVNTEEPAWTVSISTPEFALSRVGQMQVILCRTDPEVQLVDCEFSFFHAALSVGVILKPGHYNDSDSQKVQNMKFDQIVGRPHGRGMQHGECGMRLAATFSYQQQYYVGCRVRTEHRDWAYNFTRIVRPDWHPDEVTLTTDATQPFLRPGSSLRVECRPTSPQRVEECHFQLPGETPKEITELSPGHQHNDTKYRVSIDADNGLCQIQVHNVSAFNLTKYSVIMCGVSTRPGVVAKREYRINVAERDVKNPLLTLSRASSDSGNTLMAQCTAPSSLPAASITWLVDGKPVTPPGLRQELWSSWRWWHEKTFTREYFTMTVDHDVDEMEVKCVTSYMYSTTTDEASIKFSFKQGNLSVSGQVNDIVSGDVSVGVISVVVVVAVVAILVAVVVTVLAKQKKRWCFKKSLRITSTY